MPLSSCYSFCITLPWSLLKSLPSEHYQAVPSSSQVPPCRLCILESSAYGNEIRSAPLSLCYSVRCYTRRIRESVWASSPSSSQARVSLPQLRRPAHTDLHSVLSAGWVHVPFTQGLHPKLHENLHPHKALRSGSLRLQVCRKYNYRLSSLELLYIDIWIFKPPVLN